ncbi:MAG: hypothetical protein GXY32_00375 [Ruminococcaceae bacterium]|nr:hypothetical protein [Oscillospiraceae bacterium]
MDRAKIFRYELRRVALSKPFIFITAVTLVYAAYLLKTEVMFGYADTAPFSPWSFLAYLCRLLPFLCAAMLFFVSRQLAPREKAVETLASATPTPGYVRKGIKLGTIAVAFLCAALLVLLAYALFCVIQFQYTGLGWMWPLAVLVVLPALFFYMGVGLWLGKVHHNLVYLLLALLFFAAFAGFSMPPAVDLFGNAILAGAQSAALREGVIPFAVPAQYLVSRIVMGLAGLGLSAWACLVKG